MIEHVDDLSYTAYHHRWGGTDMHVLRDTLRGLRRKGKRDDRKASRVYLGVPGFDLGVVATTTDGSNRPNDATETTG